MLVDQIKHCISFFLKGSRPKRNVMLMYHGIRKKSSIKSRYELGTERFKKHLSFVKSNYGTDLNILLSFDDGARG